MQELEENSAERLKEIEQHIARAAKRFGPGMHAVCLVAVSKMFAAADIKPILNAGHRVFGENRVQEAASKWPELKQQFDGVRLHLIGPLQTNKVKEAVALFDVIETVDREKLAGALAKEFKRVEVQLPCFVQVNIGAEPQKAGITIAETVDFVAHCQQDLGLNIDGLMCIPPAQESAGPYFAQLNELAKLAGVAGLSMGMSADFQTAIEMGATHVRIGSKLFGQRPAGGWQKV